MSIRRHHLYLLVGLVALLALYKLITPTDTANQEETRTEETQYGQQDSENLTLPAFTDDASSLATSIEQEENVDALSNISESINELSDKPLIAPEESDSKEEDNPYPNKLDKYYPPHEDRVRYTQDLLAKYDSDTTGEVATQLFYLYNQCEHTPDNEEQLQNILLEVENSMLMSSENNGMISSRINSLMTIYNDCIEMQEMSSENSSMAYLERGVQYSDPRAMSIRTVITPEGFNDWSENKKRHYRKKMGRMLEKARAQCDIQAIINYSTDYSEGRLWDNQSKGIERNDNIRRYANTLLKGLYYSNQAETQSKAKGKLINAERMLKKLAQDTRMSSDAIEKADKLGRQMFRDFCK